MIMAPICIVHAVVINGGLCIIDDSLFWFGNYVVEFSLIRQKNQCDNKDNNIVML